MKQLNRIIYSISLILIIIDQCIKILITGTDAVNQTIPLIPGLLYFRPVQNTAHTWFGSLGIPLMGNGVLKIVVCIFLLFLAIRILPYFKKVQYQPKAAVIAGVCLLAAGVSCSFLDTALWGGS